MKSKMGMITHHHSTFGYKKTRDERGFGATHKMTLSLLVCLVTFLLQKVIFEPLLPQCGNIVARVKRHEIRRRLARQDHLRGCTFFFFFFF